MCPALMQRMVLLDESIGDSLPAGAYCNACMQVQECYEVSADYEGKGDTTKLGELSAKLMGLAPVTPTSLRGPSCPWSTFATPPRRVRSRTTVATASSEGSLVRQG